MDFAELYRRPDVFRFAFYLSGNRALAETSPPDVRPALTAGRRRAGQ